MAARIDIPTDFGFTEDHDLLRGEARRFLEERCPIGEVRRLFESGEGWDRGLWKEIAQLGWVGLVLPEQYGGAGFGFLHLALLMEEMGRRCLPGPYLGALLGGLALERAGSEAQKERWLPAVASGETLATFAFVEEGGAFEPDAVAAAAEPAGDGFVLRGTKTHVVGGADAGLVVAPFRLGDGVALFTVELPTEAVAAEPEISLDAARPTARLRFDGARVGADARLEGGDAAALADVLIRGAAALAAEQVGGIEAVLRMTRDYAIERKQFDRPIGFFQAVKYPIVDMMVGCELSRSLAYAAAAALDHDSAGAETAARMAKAHASDTFATAVRKGVQLHGGYGFTIDCDVHYWFRRAIWTRPMLGDAAHHRRRLAAALFPA